MKYFKEFLAYKFKIQPLGELTSEEIFSSDGELIGESVVIDGYEIGLQVWYADYAQWLEEKIEKYYSEEPEKPSKKLVRDILRNITLNGKRLSFDPEDEIKLVEYLENNTK